MRKEEEKRRLNEELTDVENKKEALLWEINGEPDEFEEPNDNDPLEDVNKLQRKGDKLKEDLRKIEIEEENEIKAINFNRVLTNELAIIDKESEVDLLGRTSQAKAIARLIANKQTVAPVTIGIYGKWGRGKSTFAQLITKNLAEINKNIDEKDFVDNEYNKSHIVKFNPTEYDDHKMIWYAILKELYKKYDEEKGFIGRVAFASRNLFPSFKSNRGSFKIILILLILNIMTYLMYFNAHESIFELIQKSKLYINLLAAGLFITTIIQLIVPLIQKMLFIIKPLSSNMLQHMLIPDYKAKLGTREEVKESLDDLLKIWLKNNENIVLVVDELDRCSENTIVEFFSAIQLFLPSNSIIKVISMNEELVALALANNNQFMLKDEATREEKIAFGHEYLQKYISIPIHLNPHSDYKHYVETLLGNELNFFHKEEKETIIALIGDVARVKEVTPREIKRIINLLILSKENVVTHFESLKYKITFSEYVKWFFVDYFNPTASRFFVNNIKKKIYYNEYKYMNFQKMYPLFLHGTSAKSEEKIHYLKSNLDIKIEVIIAADYLIQRSMIR